MIDESIPVGAIIALQKARYGYYGSYSDAWKKSHHIWETSPQDAAFLAWYNLRHITGQYAIANERTIYDDFRDGRLPTAISFEDAYLKHMLDVVNSSISYTIVDQPKNELLKYAKIQDVQRELQEFVRTLVQNRVKFLKGCLRTSSKPPSLERIDKDVISSTFGTPVKGKIDLVLREDSGTCILYELKVKEDDLQSELLKTIPGTNIPTMFFDIMQAGLYGEIWNASYSHSKKDPVFLVPIPDGRPAKVNHFAVAKLVPPLLEELKELRSFDSDTIQKLDESMVGKFKEPVNWRELIEVKS